MKQNKKRMSEALSYHHILTGLHQSFLKKEELKISLRLLYDILYRYMPIQLSKISKKTTVV
jgi:hypothetical protein